MALKRSLSAVLALSLIQAVPALAQDTGPEPELESDKASDIASITSDRGIVTQPGRFTIEPSFSHAHSNSTLVAIEGYTVIPALLVGLINISEVQRDVFVGALSLKYGFTSRFEGAIRIPWLSINEDLREREAFQGTPVDTLRESSGEGLGDIELSVRYQLNDGLDDWPYLISALRVRGPTGEGPYEVERTVVRDNQGNPIGIELSERPTGSGFWAFEPGLSLIYPSAPAVLFANLSYVWTLKEEKGFDNGGTVDPGDIVRVGFGMGFAVNERTSFSLGYEHSVIRKTTFERSISLTDTQFDRVQVGSLSFGLAQRLGASSSLNLSVALGITENAPSSEVTIKLPFSL